MAASAALDAVGTPPISFTDSTGTQKSVPLSALKFSGSKPDIADDWAPEFNAPDKGTDKTTVPAVAAARIAAGELTPPPTRPPRPAIAVTAVQPGSESNNIVVAVTIKPSPDPSRPLSPILAFSATEMDTTPDCPRPLRRRRQSASKHRPDRRSPGPAWSWSRPVPSRPRTPFPSTRTMCSRPAGSTSRRLPRESGRRRRVRLQLPRAR
jgi:hypothetical protein